MMVDVMQSRLMEIAVMECQKRSIALGVKERPGGLPKTDGDLSNMEKQAGREAQIIAAMRKGVLTTSAIVAAVGGRSWVGYAMIRLETAGLVRAVRKTRQGMLWELTEGGHD